MVSHEFIEGFSATKPPFSYGTYYNYWKLESDILKSMDHQSWIMLEEGYSLPTITIEGVQVPKSEGKWTKEKWKRTH